MNKETKNPGISKRPNKKSARTALLCALGLAAMSALSACGTGVADVQPVATVASEQLIPTATAVAGQDAPAVTATPEQQMTMDETATMPEVEATAATSDA